VAAVNCATLPLPIFEAGRNVTDVLKNDFANARLCQNVLHIYIAPKA
jgi:hypothetical protein